MVALDVSWITLASWRRTLVALTLISALVGCVTARRNGPDERVVLSAPFELTSADDLSGFLAIKLSNLAKIDPDHPLADDNAVQTLSMFGREDLIAAISDDYQSTGCAPLARSINVLDEIERRAHQTSIVIINESHERSEHRGFIAEVARRLRPLGYDTLAMEALQNDPPSTPKRYLSPFLKKPDLPYLEDEDGFYLSEAGFGRLGRKAKALGYLLLPYELNEDDGLPPEATIAQRIAVREQGQARNLISFLQNRLGTKLLIHVGYHHATEVPTANGVRWMATRLKKKTGIDPLTISQTTCHGGGKTVRFAVLPADQPTGTFDLLVDHPTARFDRGRPEWRKLAGDEPVNIPPALQPETGWRVIEARPVDESAASVPMDRVAIRPGENIALMLPPGHYRLRAIDVAQTGSTIEKSQTERLALDGRLWAILAD